MPRTCRSQSEPDDDAGKDNLKLAGERFKAGVVLYDGEATLGFGNRLFAVPIRLLWESPAG